MSERFVNDITLQYLTSKDFESRVQNVPRPAPKQLKKDRKFYKKRILDLTKRMMREMIGKESIEDEEPLQVSTDVQHTFDNYVKSCIEFFQVSDKTGILQEEYNGITTENNELDIQDGEGCKNQQYADELFVKNVRMKTNNTLDKFVIRRPKSNINDKATEKLPRKKNIKLNDPSLKLKGIEKKKNLDNKYEERYKETNKGKETRGSQQNENE